MSSDDEAIRRLLAEVRLLEGSARIIQSRLDVVNSAIGEVAVAQTTLEGMKTQPEGAESLVPVGSGSFIQTRLSEVSKVVMGIGAGVCVEKSLDASVDELRSRLDELEKIRVALQEQLGQALGKVEDQRAKLGELLKKKGAGTVAIL